MAKSPVWAALVLLAAAACGAAAEPSASPHAAVRPVTAGEVRWTGGFWKDRFDACRTATLPHLWRVMSGTEYSQFLENFRVAAGRAEGRHRGAVFNDGELYKWVEAASAVYAATRDPALLPPLDEAVAAIRAAQRPDGYLHTKIQTRQRQGDPEAQEFRDPLQFEAYNLGHLMTAACVHHRATGKPDLLDAARKAADYLDRLSQNATPDFARSAVCPSHYMGLVELYRETREPRYLKLAERLVALRDTVHGGTDDNQDRIPLRRQTKAVGHAVRANYLYAGVADLVLETGDPTLRPPLTAVWDDVVATKLSVTGGCGALYDGASPDGAADQKSIARVHQAYGRDYQIPNATAHNETCAAVGLALWSWRMLQLTGGAKHADMLERVLYNAAPAGVSLDGTRFFYTNPLRLSDPPPADLRWPRERRPFLSSFCCPPNLARTIAESAGYAYGKSDRGVWVHLYGASELTTDLPGGGRLTLTQATDYPWDGRVRLTIAVDRPATFSLFLRIPTWAAGRSGFAGYPA
ncbi:MAG TPA: beta-L-arabinofuranosidase domain-containing protein, partial [Gemmataceae bacterium]